MGIRYFESFPCLIFHSVSSRRCFPCGFPLKKTLESLYAPFKFPKFIFFFKTLEIGKYLGFKCQPLFSPQISLNNEPRALESVSLIAYL